jgi:hypothetical protein
VRNGRFREHFVAPDTESFLGRLDMRTEERCPYGGTFAYGRTNGCGHAI